MIDIVVFLKEWVWKPLVIRFRKFKPDTVIAEFAADDFDPALYVKNYLEIKDRNPKVSYRNFDFLDQVRRDVETDMIHVAVNSHLISNHEDILIDHNRILDTINPIISKYNEMQDRKDRDCATLSVVIPYEEIV